MRNLDNELDKAEKKLKEYQKKKLVKVNQLIVSYSIKLSQVEYLVKMNNRMKMHEDFSSVILFTNEIFNRLAKRIEELKIEKIDIEKKQKILTRKLSKL